MGAQPATRRSHLVTRPGILTSRGARGAPARARNGSADADHAPDL